MQERREAVEQSEIAQTVVPIQNHSKSVSALLVPPLVCLSICAIAGLTIYLKQALTWKDIKGRFQSFRQSKQIPCKKCRFLCNNKYIKCAVHPYKALTISARNCPDFWDRDSNHFFK